MSTLDETNIVIERIHKIEENTCDKCIVHVVCIRPCENLTDAMFKMLLEEDKGTRSTTWTRIAMCLGHQISQRAMSSLWAVYLESEDESYYEDETSSL